MAKKKNWHHLSDDTFTYHSKKKPTLTVSGRRDMNSRLQCQMICTFIHLSLKVETLNALQLSLNTQVFFSCLNKESDFEDDSWQVKTM